MAGFPMKCKARYMRKGLGTFFVFSLIAATGIGLGIWQRAVFLQAGLADFERSSAASAERMRVLFASYSRGMEQAAGSINSAGYTDSELRSSVGALVDSLEGLRNIHYCPLIAHANRTTFVDEVRARYNWSTYEIVETVPDAVTLDAYVTRGNYSEYLPKLMGAKGPVPFAAGGFDMFSEPNRFESVARARVSNRIVASRPMRLLNTPLYGFVLVAPLYEVTGAIDPLEGGPVPNSVVDASLWPRMRFNGVLAAGLLVAEPLATVASQAAGISALLLEDITDVVNATLGEPSMWRPCRVSTSNDSTPDYKITAATNLTAMLDIPSSLLPRSATCTSALRNRCGFTCPIPHAFGFGRGYYMAGLRTLDHASLASVTGYVGSALDNGAMPFGSGGATLDVPLSNVAASSTSAVSQQDGEAMVAAARAVDARLVAYWMFSTGHRTFALTVIASEDTVYAPSRFVLGTIVGSACACAFIVAAFTLAMWHQAGAAQRERMRRQKERASLARAAAVTHQKTTDLLAHELKNPLHAAASHIELLLQSLPRWDAPARSDALTVSHAVQGIIRLLDDASDLASLRHNKMRIVPAPASVTAAMLQAVRVHTPFSTVPISLLVSRSVPRSLLVDIARLQQLVAIGLSNGIRATFNGGVLVHVTLARTLAEVNDLAQHGGRAGRGGGGNLCDNTGLEKEQQQTQTPSSSSSRRGGKSAGGRTTGGASSPGGPASQYIMVRIMDTGVGLGDLFTGSASSPLPWNTGESEDASTPSTSSSMAVDLSSAASSALPDCISGAYCLAQDEYARYCKKMNLPLPVQPCDRPAAAGAPASGAAAAAAGRAPGGVVAPVARRSSSSVSAAARPVQVPQSRFTTFTGPAGGSASAVSGQTPRPASAAGTPTGSGGSGGGVGTGNSLLATEDRVAHAAVPLTKGSGLGLMAADLLSAAMGGSTDLYEVPSDADNWEPTLALNRSPEQTSMTKLGVLQPHKPDELLQAVLPGNERRVLGAAIDALRCSSTATGTARSRMTVFTVVVPIQVDAFAAEAWTLQKPRMGTQATQASPHRGHATVAVRSASAGGGAVAPPPPAAASAATAAASPAADAFAAVPPSSSSASSASSTTTPLLVAGVPLAPLAALATVATAAKATPAPAVIVSGGASATAPQRSPLPSPTGTTTGTNTTAAGTTASAAAPSSAAAKLNPLVVVVAAPTAVSATSGLAIRAAAPSPTASTADPRSPGGAVSPLAAATTTTAGGVVVNGTLSPRVSPVAAAVDCAVGAPAAVRSVLSSLGVRSAAAPSATTTTTAAASGASAGSAQPAAPCASNPCGGSGGGAASQPPVPPAAASPAGPCCLCDDRALHYALVQHGLPVPRDLSRARMRNLRLHDVAHRLLQQLPPGFTPLIDGFPADSPLFWTSQPNLCATCLRGSEAYSLAAATMLDGPSDDRRLSNGSSVDGSAVAHAAGLLIGDGVSAGDRTEDALGAASEAPTPAAHLLPARPLNLLYCDDESVNRRIVHRHLTRLGYSCLVLDDGIHVPYALAASQMLPPSGIAKLADIGTLPVAIPPPIINGLRDHGLIRPDAQVPLPSVMTWVSSGFDFETPVDAVLLDLAMVHSDGRDICRDLRGKYRLPATIPIIAVTANAHEESQSLVDLGFTAVITKPFTFERLEAVLSEVEVVPTLPHPAGTPSAGAATVRVTTVVA